MSMNILVLNAGSSTQKCFLYGLADDDLPEQPPTPLWEAQLDDVRLKVSTAGGTVFEETLSSAAPSDTLLHILETLWNGPTRVLEHATQIDLVGHRVVHGGRTYIQPTLITPEVKAGIADLSTLAPAHNPAALAGIEAVEQCLGDTPQLAVFDTAFHSSIPDAAAVYPVPYAWTEQGARRYGFHGISHAYAAGRAAEILGRDLASLRLITCHLGNGCSLAAVRSGQSVDTTMGFTPLEGLMMGTRSGSVDPGLLLYLMRQKGYSADELAQALNSDSGLKGVSGVSGDMRDIVAAMADGHPRAKLAFDIYTHRVRFYVGAMLASLGGLDALVFTAGVGEHSAPVRAAVCEDLAFLGLQLDSEKNERSPVDTDIASSESPVRVLVIHAQENWAIARSSWAFAREKS